MSNPLESLLGLRRHTEAETEKGLGIAMAGRAKAEDEQRLHDGRAHEARARRQTEGQRLGQTAPPNTAEAVARHAFLRRLDDDVRRLDAAAKVHRDGALAAALRADESARNAHREARREREALEAHMARLAAEEARLRERRAEDASGDLAIAAHAKAKADRRGG